MKKFLTFLLCLGFAFAFTACGKDNGNGSESSGTETSFYTVTAAYDYGSHIKGKPYMLYDDSWLFFDLPEDYGEVVAGDTFTIEYTGELQINYTYPGQIYVLNGEIVSVTAQKAEIVGLTCEVSESNEIEFFLYEGGCIVGEQVKIETCPKYYLTNDNGEIGCEELTVAADGMAFYGTYSPVNGYDETDGYTLSGLYAWNPRESGEIEEQTSTYTVVAEYDYSLYVGNRLSILYGGCELFFDIPEEHGEVIAGDSFLITYTGELTIYETQPSGVSISGEIVSVTAQKAETVVLICQVGWAPAEVGEVDTIDFYLYNDGEVGEKVKIENSPKYYLTNDNGEIGCEELTVAADGMAFYGTYSPVNGYDETDGYRLSGLYTWNPREE